MNETKTGITTDLTDEQIEERAQAAVRLALEKQKALGVPIVFCDPKTRKIYKLLADGTKVEVDMADLEEEQNGHQG